MFNISFMGTNYRYYGIAQEIIEYIHRHNLIPGSKIPGIRKLAKMFKCGKNTVMAAFDYLIREGYIEPVEKTGNFVAAGAWREADSQAMWLKYKERGWQASGGDAFKTHCLSVDQYALIPGVLAISPEYKADYYIARAMEEVAVLIAKNPLVNKWSKNGLESTREVLCAYLKGKGIDARPDNIIFTTGTTNALSIINQAFLSKGMYLLAAEPSPYASIAAPHISLAGAHSVSIAMDEEGIMIDEIMKQQYFGRAMLAVSSVHQYPTGLSMSCKRKEQLLKTCIEMQIPIIEMDNYSDCMPYNSIKTMDETGSVLYCGTLRHMFALGLNVGWIVAPPFYMNRILDVAARQSMYQPNINHLILEVLLKNGYYNAYLKDLKAGYAKRVGLTNRLLEFYLGEYATWNPAHSGFLFWIKLAGINVDYLLNSLRHILITEGTICSQNYENYFSLCPFSLTGEELEISIKAISRGIKRLLKDTGFQRGNRDYKDNIKTYSSHMY